ncbi:MAG TPA: hypothetical protein VIL26_03505, partial [Clostridia bacterium]
MKNSITKNLRQKLNPVDSGLGFLGAILALFGATFVFEFIVILFNISNFINNPNFLNQLLEKSWFIISSSIVTQGTLLGFCFLLCKIRHVDF